MPGRAGPVQVPSAHPLALNRRQLLGPQHNHCRGLAAPFSSVTKAPSNPHLSAPATTLSRFCPLEAESVSSTESRGSLHSPSPHTRHGHCTPPQNSRLCPGWSVCPQHTPPRMVGSSPQNRLTGGLPGLHPLHHHDLVLYAGVQNGGKCGSCSLKTHYVHIKYSTFR